MKQKQLRRTRRTAFTLIELLVVMAIIAVLVSLFVGAAVQILNKIDEVKTRNDIEQMSMALVDFQAKNNVDYVPSQIILCEVRDNYFADAPTDTVFKSQLHQDSYNYLKRLWPRLNWNTVHTPVVGNPPPPPWAGIDWNGDTLQSPDVLLEGDQCLVFFLGGIGGSQGFSSNATNPAQQGGDRVAPFFSFKASRFVYRNGYPSYVDPYGKMPYAYFSSYKALNGYNRYGSSDCPTLGVFPYFAPPPPNAPPNTPPVYYNPDTFQIISAGRDTLFGPGGAWTPANAGNIAPAGKDDMANFAERMLGIPQ